MNSSSVIASFESSRAGKRAPDVAEAGGDPGGEVRPCLLPLGKFADRLGEELAGEEAAGDGSRRVHAERGGAGQEGAGAAGFGEMGPGSDPDTGTTANLPEAV